MLIVVVLLMTAYEVLMVEVVRLNQAGPEWEVPISIVMKLASLEPILTVLFCASIVLVFICKACFPLSQETAFTT